MYRPAMAMYPLFDLQQVLRSKKETLEVTLQEANIWNSWKSETRRNVSVVGVGLFGAGAAVLAASWKLAFRMLLSSGASVSFGMWMLGRSSYSCADKILKMHGSTLQNELGNIMVTKYHNEPSLMPLMSKHFYSERIFDDSTSENPKLSYRIRNFFIDDAVRDYYDNTQGDSHSDSYNNSQGDSGNYSDSRKTNLENKHNFHTKAGPDIMAELDPLDFLFGYGAPVKETHGPTTPSKPSGTHNRRHRRSHRIHRMRNTNDLSNTRHAATL